MSAAFLQRLARDNHPLLPRIWEFNFQSARDIHAARFSGYGGCLEKLFGNRRALALLSGNLRWAGAEVSGFSSDFEDERARLALLDGKSLRKLAALFGAAAFHEDIKKAVLKKDVLAWREAVGAEACEFAAARAALLAGKGAEGIFPRTDEPLPEQARMIGWRAAAAVCAGLLPEGARARFRLKLPPEAEKFLEDKPDAETAERAWKILKKLWVREVAPEWAACLQ